MTIEGIFSCKQASHCWPGDGNSSIAPLPVYKRGLSLNTSDRPISVFLTKRYNIEASALCKLFERRWKSVFRLHSSLLLCAPKALAKLAEVILSYLFVRKTLIGQKPGSMGEKKSVFS